MCRVATGIWHSTALPICVNGPVPAYLMMGMVGNAGLAAITGGGLYIFLTVGSLLWGKKLDGGGGWQHLHPVHPTAPIRRSASLWFCVGVCGTRNLCPGDGFPRVLRLVLPLAGNYLSQVWGLAIDFKGSGRCCWRRVGPFYLCLLIYVGAMYTL